MMVFSSWVVILLVFFGELTKVNAQMVIWAENFDSYPDGSTQGADLNPGNPDLDWISWGCQSCPDSLNDWWEVRSGLMEAHDVNSLVSWKTETIPIAAYENVQFSIDIKETGDHEGFYFGSDDCLDQGNQDYVNVLYRLDGGSWNLINNYLGWCGLYESCGSHTLHGDDGVGSGDCRPTDDDFDSVRIVQSGISGDSLEIQVEMINSSDEEFLRLDNVEVQGWLLLPVVWRNFNVMLKDRQVVLRWETASERDSRNFEILKSHTDPRKKQNWELLASVPAMGQADGITSYEYIDREALWGTIYYQLKQLDFDGDYQFSEIRSVKIPGILHIWPNPSGGMLNIDWKQRSGQQINCKVLNTLGQKVFESALNGSKSVNLGHLRSGWYVVQLHSGSDIKTQTIRIK